MAKCIKCGKHVCRLSASYYSPPLSQMCKACRMEELKKIAKEK
jgi:endogenous inhibitor of DNA gyrase (YacG/DUF329 family)